ncbi:hypothetical protein [Bradyrhizobium prioriisuperbiae]|uniref:hypothetical protein n=1 Tax=Bradyrhizobium prioriisuperbiae TaxID=2854389 RepID=UPI0028E35F66|nr:hypothetical protein [Bradyrhizobium prioritasuperba]
MSLLKWIVLGVMGVTLAGCAGSFTAPSPAGLPMAWDGNGTPPTDDVRPTRKPRRATAVIETAPIAAVTSAPADAYAQQQADDSAREAALKKRMVICRDCLPNETGDIVTGSITTPPLAAVASKQ